MTVRLDAQKKREQAAGGAPAAGDQPAPAARVRGVLRPGPGRPEHTDRTHHLVAGTDKAGAASMFCRHCQEPTEHLTSQPTDYLCPQAP